MGLMSFSIFIPYNVITDTWLSLIWSALEINNISRDISFTQTDTFHYLKMPYIGQSSIHYRYIHWEILRLIEIVIVIFQIKATIIESIQKSLDFVKSLEKLVISTSTTNRELVKSNIVLHRNTCCIALIGRFRSQFTDEN